MTILPCNPPPAIFRLRRSRAGYTLVEIMLVLAIISVLVGAGIYALVGNLDIARMQTAENTIKTIETQLGVYEMQNRRLPSTQQGLQALVIRPTTEPVPRKWIQLMKEVPIDPWGNPFQYRYPGTRNSSGYDLFSFGPDGKESDDDIGNWQ